MTLQLLAVLGLIWLVVELCLTRPSGLGATSKDHGSLGVLWLVEVVSIGLAIMAAYNFPDFGLPGRNVVYVLGVCVFVMGLALRVYSIFHLGRYFTINVAIATDHRLIDSGPYRFVRHPSYTGALMLYFALGLSLGNWLSVVVIFLPIFGAFWWRMEIEEAALIEALGEPYCSYMRRTKRLIPMIY
jgi:protein-S-isoprenylcysteine O-methyltransferase